MEEAADLVARPGYACLSMTRSLTIRRATRLDMPAVARLAARLVRFHHALDRRRFLCVEPLEAGYERWLSHEVEDPRAVILVAEEAGAAGAREEGAVAGETPAERTAPGETPAARTAAGETPLTIVGYAYGRVEARDWNALLDAHGALHDVYVADEARARGTGAALVTAVADDLRKLGAPRVVLHTATQNVAAQRLFQKLGFRSTMIEMTREIE